MKYLTLFLFISCASSSEWHRQTVAVEDEIWNWCSSELDAPEFVGKGWCYTEVETRDRIWPLKNEERVVRHFCAAGDITCLRERHLTEKFLVSNPF